MKLVPLAFASSNHIFSCFICSSNTAGLHPAGDSDRRIFRPKEDEAHAFEVKFVDELLIGDSELRQIRERGHRPCTSESSHTS